MIYKKLGKKKRNPSTFSVPQEKERNVLTICCYSHNSKPCYHVGLKAWRVGDNYMQYKNIRHRHRRAEVESKLWRSYNQPLYVSPVKLAMTTPSWWPWLCPDGFWVSLLTESPQILWATCASVWPPSQCFLMFEMNSLVLNLCLLPLGLLLGTTEKSLVTVSSSHHPTRTFIHIMGSPWALSSPGWQDPALSLSKCRKTLPEIHSTSNPGR